MTEYWISYDHGFPLLQPSPILGICLIHFGHFDRPECSEPWNHDVHFGPDPLQFLLLAGTSEVPAARPTLAPAQFALGGPATGSRSSASALAPGVNGCFRCLIHFREVRLAIVTSCAEPFTSRHLGHVPMTGAKWAWLDYRGNRDAADDFIYCTHALTYTAQRQRRDLPSVSTPHGGRFRDEFACKTLRKNGQGVGAVIFRWWQCKTHCRHIRT